jgi:hypothetical protein
MEVYGIGAFADVRYARRTAGMNPRRKMAYDFFIEQTTWPAYAFGLLVSVSVIAAVVLLMVETLPAVRRSPVWTQYVAYIVDCVVMALWTIELIGRFYGHPNRWRFFRDPLNIVDVLSILPFYIQFWVPVTAGFASLSINSASL